jgi:hypothetical protein
MRKNLAQDKLLWLALGISILVLIYFLIPGESEDKKIKITEKDPQNKNLEFLRTKDKQKYSHKRLNFPLSVENKPKIYAQEIRDYRARARYPHYSTPIPVIEGKIIDPIVEDTAIIPAEMTNPNYPYGPTLIHYIEKNNYSPGEKVIIHAYLLDEQRKKMKTDRLKATLTDIGGKGKKINIAKMMSDSGGTGDYANDLIYTAVFPTYMLKKAPWNYMIIIRWDVEDEKSITVTNAFNYGALNIEVENTWEDYVVNDERGGSLAIRGKFNIIKAGTFHLRGALYSEDNEPIGESRKRVKLSAGSHWVELIFDGILFCESKKSGPYILKYFILANVSAMPGPRSGRLEDLHVTENYDVGEFTCDPYEDPVLSDKAKLGEQEFNDDVAEQLNISEEPEE